MEGEVRGIGIGLSSRAEVRDKVRGEYRVMKLMYGVKNKRNDSLRNSHRRIFF